METVSGTRHRTKKAFEKSTLERVERSKAEAPLKGRGQSFGSENLVNDSSVGVSVDLQGQGQWSGGWVGDSPAYD